MALKLKQSTASQEVPLGFFVDSTDGNTEETGLTIANTDIKLWKAGATTLANKNSGGATHIANGIYYAVLDATDTNTLGPLVIFCHVAGALPVRVECEVLPANVYDALIAGSDYLQTDAVQVEGADATDQVNAACDTALTDYDAPTKAELDAAVAPLATAASLATVASYVDTEVAAILAAVDTEVAAIKAKTDNLPAAPAATGDIPSAATIADAVWDEATAGHVAAGSTGLALTSASAPTAAAVADAVWDELVADHAGVGSTGAALAAAGGSGDPWATALPGAYGAGTAGKLIGDNINAPIATVDTVVDAIKAKTDSLPASPAAVGSAMTLANGAVTAAAIATNAIDADALAADAATEIADALLKRDLSAVTGEAARSPINALRALRNKAAISGATLTVYKEDDSTSAWTAAVATDAAADPIISVDPA